MIKRKVSGFSQEQNHHLTAYVGRISNAWTNFQYNKNEKINFTVLPALKTERGVEVKLYSFFNLGARWRWMITPLPGCFPSGNDPVLLVLETASFPGNESLQTVVEVLANNVCPTSVF